MASPMLNKNVKYNGKPQKAYMTVSIMPSEVVG
jgi:hypothetical protein